MMKFIKLEKTITLLILVGLWLFFLRHAMQPDRSLAMNNDNEFMNGPALAAISESLRNGSWPLRMNTVLGGFPLYNFTLLTAFYPFYFTFLPIYKGPLDIIHSMHWVALLHILILEINMFIFIRVLGASRFASIVGSALTAFSANSLIYVKWVNIIAPYAWLPLYFAGLIGILKEPESKKYFAMATAGITLLTLASPAQPLIHAVVVTAVFLFFFCLDKYKKGEIKGIYPQISTLAWTTGSSLLIVAPVIIPAVADFKDMVRWVGVPPPAIGYARMSFRAFTHDQLAVTDLAGIFLNFRTAAVGAPFIGAIALILASFAACIRFQSWLVKALVFLAIYSLISSTGSNLGLAYINYVIPLLDKIRQPSRFLIFFIIPVSVLAAFGIDELKNLFLSNADRKKTSLFFKITAVVSGLMLLALIIGRESIEFTFHNIASLTLVAVLFLTTGLVYSRSMQYLKPKLSSIWGISALLLLTLQVPWKPNFITSSKYLTQNGLSLDLAIDRINQLDPSHEYRVIFDGKLEKKLASALASYHGVRTFNSTFCPAPLTQFKEFYYHKAKPNNYYRTLGAKYLICKECPPKAVQGYSFMETVAGYDIYTSTDVLPDYYITHQIDGYYNTALEFERKAATKELTNTILFLDSKTKIKALPDSGNSANLDSCLLKQDSNSGNYLRFVIQCNSPGIFVLNEFFNKGWKSSVDGSKINILKVNGSQMGIPFKPGSHIIEFTYLPSTFFYSLPIMVLGIGCFIYLFNKKFL